MLYTYNSYTTTRKTRFNIGGLASVFDKRIRRRSSRRCSKRFKGCKRIYVKVVSVVLVNASQGLGFIDSSCLVKKTIGRVMTLSKPENHWKRYIF